MNQKKVKTNFFIIIAICLIGLFLNCPNSVVVGNFSFNKPKIPFINNDLRYGLDLAGGASLNYSIDISKTKKEDVQDALDSLKENIEKRINPFGTFESTIQLNKIADENRILIELPGVQNVEEAISSIGETPQLNFKGVVDETLFKEATNSADLNKSLKDTGLNGSYLSKATVQLNSNNSKPEVLLEFNPEGAKLFETATKEFLNKQIAISLDGEIKTAPVVNVVISDGKAAISGNFDTDEAKILVRQLNAGVLPLPITLIEQRSTNATLGKDSIDKGLLAGVVGLLAVCFFMIIIYRYLGFIATLSLIIYGLITVSLYRLLSITLTFPGIVGLILSIGMAVDSNILIFERIKEERLRGKDWSSAIDIGFDRAWGSIKDANTCTIITGLILINPLKWNFLNSSGMVRGFAITLLLGIFVGIFSSIFITKNILLTFIPEDKEQK